MQSGCTATWLQLFRKPTCPRFSIPGMRLILLALPVVLTVLMLVACGGKGGGGY
jgi:hypothetical protein